MRTKVYGGIRLCVVVSVWISMTIKPTQSSPDYVSLARCTAYCIKEFTSPPAEGDGCLTADCASCSNSCFLVFDNPHNVHWRAVCRAKTICTPSCQQACDFRKHMRQGRVVGKWDMNIVSENSDLEKTVIEWNVTSASNVAPPGLIYVVLVRDLRAKGGYQGWGHHRQITTNFIEFKTEELFPESEIWIRAVSENGTIADRKLTISTMYAQPQTKPQSQALELQVHEPTSVDGKVLVTISWQNSEIPDGVVVPYLLSWFRKDCQAYEDSPYCELPEDAFFETVDGVGKTKVTKTLRWLSFNTRFDLRLEATYKDKKWFVKKTFLTPFCHTVSESFERCLQEQSVVGIPNTTISPGEGLWVANMAQASRDPTTNMVKYNISWVSLFNQSTTLYNISWRDQASNALGFKSVAGSQMSTTLDLPANSSYEIKVVATYLTADGYWSIAGEKPFTVTPSTAVTDKQPMQVLAKREPVHPAKGELDGLIIGGTCIATGIIIACIIFVIYKKRQSFKDVILTKTAVTKSNSYKSSMGYKADYANELLVVTDDWEVDPQQLKFSTPLGQGAFGKVVTGYCDERKVAIKILKDCAPLSYKEDLLAEISLMKKLGAHPNIVSLVGACTLHEPIALIMEYVPYGSLQSFLKKCRQEGELRKRGHRRELTYSMVDAHGSIENGVITPTDILSFARQIVMAMEYLAEKKYVHRDLAARNVLLDYNKVVKVCDFGLSRDIYHDNQYKKLTSGKLPIKWMAIESLRDRVFTTQSDVWSFGILLWETVTMGASPYPNIALSDLFYMLSNGYRMEKPSNCSDELYSIMRHSWKESPKERPTFTQLRYYIEDLLTRDCDYLELENIDVPLNNTDSSSLPLSDPFSTSAMAAAAEATAQGRLISVSSGDEMTVDVCVHDKSTDKLLHQVENSDAVTDYRNTKQKRSDTR